MKAVLAIFLALLSLSVFTVVTVKSIQLKQNCTGYLERAASANTVEEANVQLTKAIDYLEARELTTGYTSVLWRTPDEDIAFFYRNLKASQSELSKVDSTTTALERTNVLMKLRETLMDSYDGSDVITCPDGLSLYPNNTSWGILMWLAGLILLGLIIWGMVEFHL